MFKDFLQNIRLFVAKMRVERPVSPFFPQFKTTVFFLWVVALFGLLYGRLFNISPNAYAMSLMITLVSWVVSVAIVLLQDPKRRLKLLLYQIFSIVLLLSFLVVVGITYSLLFFATNAVQSIKISWVIGSILLGVLTFYTLYHSLARATMLIDEPYPGLRTAPLLFLVLAANYVVWVWPTIIRLFL